MLDLLFFITKVFKKLEFKITSLFNLVRFLLKANKKKIRSKDYKNIVFVLWGGNALKKKDMIDGKKHKFKKMDIEN